MLTLRIGQEYPQSLADFVVCSFLANADIDEIEERLSKTERTCESKYFVRVADDAAGEQLVGQALEIEDNLNHNIPVVHVCVRISHFEVVFDFAMQLICGIGSSVFAHGKKVVLKLQVVISIFRGLGNQIPVTYHSAIAV